MKNKYMVFLVGMLLSVASVRSQQHFAFPSYKGLVMAGYQGWFNTPGDSSGRGWHHYQRRGVFGPGSCEIDCWPDVREYPRSYATPFVYAGGDTARVFSAYDAATVNLHFKWMKDYGIDGVFMQRFVAEIRNASGRRHFDKVLDNAMAAASRYRRAISIMYDLSGMAPGEEDIVLKDLDELTKKYGLLDGAERQKDRSMRNGRGESLGDRTGGGLGKGSTYLHHNGRPLVVVWGVGFNDHRRYGLAEAEVLIRGIKARGFSIMLGVPTYWREPGRDAIPDTALHRLIRDCDIVAPWFVGRYDASTYPAFKEVLTGDLAWCVANGIDYAPLAFPGFSWRNMNGPLARSIGRNGGRFFWQQVAGAREAGAEMLYIAMFDEVNEGTAIFKCNTEDHLPLNGAGGFVGIEKELGGDYYLWLAGQAARWFHGVKGYGGEMPGRK